MSTNGMLQIMRNGIREVIAANANTKEKPANMVDMGTRYQVPRSRYVRLSGLPSQSTFSPERIWLFSELWKVADCFIAILPFSQQRASRPMTQEDCMRQFPT